MKLIENTYEHNKEGFKIKVVTCNSKIATTVNLQSGEKIRFNRPKFEWMIEKGIFRQVEE